MAFSFKPDALIDNFARRCVYQLVGLNNLKRIRNFQKWREKLANNKGDIIN